MQKPIGDPQVQILSQTANCVEVKTNEMNSTSIAVWPRDIFAAPPVPFGMTIGSNTSLKPATK